MIQKTKNKYCFAWKPIHNDGECCWCDYLHQLFDDGYYDYLYKTRIESGKA